MEMYIMNDRQNLLDKVKDSFWKYKELENTKILQIFHVTVLVIIALFSEVIKKNIFAEYSLMIALIFIALGYFLLYLTDIYAANINTYVYIKESTPEADSTKIDEDIKVYNEYAKECRNLCLTSVILSYLMIFTSLVINFQFFNFDLCYYIPLFIPAYILYRALKYYYKTLV